MNILGRSPLAQQKSKCGSRYLYRVLVPLALLVVVVAAFYVFENWRGNRLWTRYRQEAEAQGPFPEPPAASWRAVESRKARAVSHADELARADENVDRAEALVREAGSDSSGLQRVDLVAWKQAFDLMKAANTNFAREIELVRSGKVKIELGNTNVDARAEAAVVVLEAFADENAVLEKLRSACLRPELLYPLGYEDTRPPWGPMPQVYAAFNLCEQLRVRTAAELAAGKSAEALRDLDLMFRLSDSLRQEPTLIGGIASVGCRTITLRSAWEGLAERRFTEPELQQLEQWLGSVDLVGGIPHFIRHEWSQMLLFMNEWENRRKPSEFLTGSSKSSAGERLRGKALYVAIRAMPAGWLQLEKLTYSRLLNEPLAAGLRDSPKRVEPLLVDRACDNVRKQLTNYNSFRGLFNHTLFSAVITPDVNGWFMNVTGAHVTSDQARLACALERYYLKHGSYPEKLEEMVPDYVAKLPLDPLSGVSYRYLRGQGRYKLWSVGWNEKDDGGLSGGPRYDRTADWVWEYPAS